MSHWEAEEWQYGEPIKWRRSPQMLISRSIPKAAFPNLIETMISTGIVCQLTEGGACWFSGRYKVTATEIKRVWGLSRTQYNRLMDYIIQNNPFERGNENV